MTAWLATVVTSMTVIGCSVWSIARLRSDRRKLAELRSPALRAFARTVARSDDDALCFEGATARIVLQEEVGGPGGSVSRYPPYTLTLHARNPAGHYFTFIYSPPHASVRPLRPEIARIVLKDRFVDPRAVG